MPTICDSGVVAQLIERYVRIVEVVGLSPISSTILRQGFGWQATVCVSGGSSKDWQKKYKKSWGYGGMVDAEDLKSFDHCDRVGSSPTIPTILRPMGFGWQATVRGTMRVA